MSAAVNGSVRPPCMVCGCPLSPALIAERRGEGVVCRACTFKEIGSFLADRQTEKTNARTAVEPGARASGWRLRILALLGLELLAVGGTLVTGTPPEPQPWTRSGMAPTQAEGRECTRTVLELRVLANRTAYLEGRPPASLEELGGPDPVCPHSDLPYEYRYQPGGSIQLACPNPEAHGVSSIRSVGTDVQPVITPWK